MNDYIALRIDATPCDADITDLLAACLADAGYDSFEPDATGLTAYVPADNFDETIAREALADFPIPTSLTLSHKTIEGRDWNAEWEKNYFQPILIADRCVIHSSFHTDIPAAEYDIVIDPRMAFGTGHHSTTSLMVSYLLDMDLEGQTVTDMGTGTGILAILAAMKGAAHVTGIEIDPGAHANAVDNAALNQVSIDLICGHAAALPDIRQSDLFIANINRNIILADLAAYTANLRQGGTMLLSGFYETDIPMLEKAATLHGLTVVEKRLHSPEGHTDAPWAALRLIKS